MMRKGGGRSELCLVSPVQCTEIHRCHYWAFFPTSQAHWHFPSCPSIFEAGNSCQTEYVTEQIFQQEYISLLKLTWQGHLFIYTHLVHTHHVSVYSWRIPRKKRSWTTPSLAALEHCLFNGQGTDSSTASYLTRICPPKFRQPSFVHFIKKFIPISSPIQESHTPILTQGNTCRVWQYLAGSEQTRDLFTKLEIWREHFMQG